MTLDQLRELAEGAGGDLLTPREREVVKLLGSGMSQVEAAAEIGVSLVWLRTTFYTGRARLEGRKPPAPLHGDSDRASETRSEVRARIAREIAAGMRCGHLLPLSREPCSLLLPCYTHRGR